MTESRIIAWSVCWRCGTVSDQRCGGSSRDSCRSWFEEEYDLLPNVRVIVSLGGFAFDYVLRVLDDRGIAVPNPRPEFRHGVAVHTGGP